MKGPQYYVGVFLEEFQSRMTYHAFRKYYGYDPSSGPLSEEELNLVKDLAKCGPAADFLDKETLQEMRKALASGFGDRNLGEFARAAKLGAKVGKKYCVDILILAIHYAREEGPSLVKWATFESFVE